MILIQLILIAAILLLLIRFLASHDSSHTQAWRKIVLLLFGIIAIVLILDPDLLNGLARLVGVGRGADLLLYALTIGFIFEQLNSYIKTKEEQNKIVILARKIAIAETLLEQEKKDG